jgi:hypothetical protein
MPARIFYEPGYKFPGTYLTVLENLPVEKAKSMVRCRCDCGNEHKYAANTIKTGHTKSCGCHKIKVATQRCLDRSTHNLSKHPLYNVWMGIKRRCEDKTHVGYSVYGGRGIYVDGVWLRNFAIFHAWAVENGWKKGLQIDRIDNDGPYAPWNCRIVTPKQNSRNRRNNVRLVYDGIEATLAEHAERLGLNYAHVKDRRRNGRSLERVFEV